MTTHRHFQVIALAGFSFALAPCKGALAQESHLHHAARVQIPSSIQLEHREILGSLNEATRTAGPVGAAAKAVADVLHSHFAREEQVALPPLGFLAPLSRGELPDGAASVMAMSDSLKAELPKMLEEHTRIRAAVAELGRVARGAGAENVVRLTEQLAQHALTEEEVLYPAAIVAGDLIRARQAGCRCHRGHQDPNTGRR